MTDETRTRFLAAIAKQLPSDRVSEIHLFSAMKQGGVESGVAVIAVARDRDAGLVEHPHERAEVDLFSPDVDDATADARAEETIVEVVHTDRNEDDAPPTGASVSDAESAPKPAPLRYTIYSARYRHTLKGLDRGKWEVNVTEEAEAPLLTVDAVVRGVQQRSGDADETVRLSGDEFRAGLSTGMPALSAG